jgi:hypothetical protein
MSGDVQVRLCVQQRLARSVGVNPTEAKVGSLVAWIPGRRETEFLKRIDEAILGMVSESSGRNESERRVTSRVMNPRGRAHNRRAKAARTAATLTDAASCSGGAVAMAR